MQNELIHQTITALNDGGITSIIPVEGQSLIDHWLETLPDNNGMQQIRTTLEELKSQLESGYPDAMTVRTILLDLADQTGVVAANASAEVSHELRQLANTIQTFGTSL